MNSMHAWLQHKERWLKISKINWNLLISNSIIKIKKDYKNRTQHTFFHTTLNTHELSKSNIQQMKQNAAQHTWSITNGVNNLSQQDGC